MLCKRSKGIVCVVALVAIMLVSTALLAVAQDTDRAAKEANSTTLVVTETTSPPSLSTFATSWTTEPLEDILNKLVS